MLNTLKCYFTVNSLLYLYIFTAFLMLRFIFNSFIINPQLHKKAIGFM